MYIVSLSPLTFETLHVLQKKLHTNIDGLRSLCSLLQPCMIYKRTHT